MKYSAVTVRNWKKDYDQGDIKTIAEENNVHRHTISKALKKGIGSLETMQLINGFYANKKIQANN